ncbi:MAG: phosphate transport system regulatory protein PhoU [Planctomycetes bacterium RBG_13_46_10]|nr:MAG: phosphate transport system regulatory protein PhoU [Planctomycetes bacterium RBG_13_46_10]
MTREIFKKHIQTLEKEVTEMGEMVVTAINRSIEALKVLDSEAAEKIIADDVKINKKRWDIEEKCINLIATQQPVASDLREIIAVLSIATDLERMGDHAEGIGKIVILHGKEPLIKPLVDIPQMADICVDMLKRSIDAFLKRDAAAATAICAEDDKVDLLHEQVYRVLLSYMIENPRVITYATYLIWAAHNLERIADRVTNICERIVFLTTGSMHEINVSRY